MSPARPASVDEYIESAPPQARDHLRAIRSILGEVSPSGIESLKWGRPVFEEDRILFSYSAHKAHLTFMPTGPAMEPFRDELREYRTGKDTIQFPYDDPLPRELIRRIAEHRAVQVREHDARWMY